MRIHRPLVGGTRRIRITDRQVCQVFGTVTLLAASVLLQARGHHEIGQVLAVAVGAAWLLHLTAARLNAKEAVTEQLHAAVHEDLGAPAAGHGIRIRQRPVLLTRPTEVPCAHCGRMGRPGELGWDLYAGHVYREACLAVARRITARSTNGPQEAA